jgi:hypothetical protein
MIKILSLLFLFSLNHLYGQLPNQLKLEDFDLNGNVKQIKTVDGIGSPRCLIERTKGISTNSILDFNKKGFIVQKKEWQKLLNQKTDTNLISYAYKKRLLIEMKANKWTTKFSYNRKKNLNQIEKYNDKNEQVKTIKYLYNRKNQLVSKQVENSINITITNCTYHKKLLTSKYIENSLRTEIDTFRYDKRGRLTERNKTVEILKPNNYQKPINYYNYFYQYNEKDSLIEFISSIGANKDLSIKEKYVYNNKNNQIGKFSYSNYLNKVSDSIIYVYNDNLLVEKQDYKYGELENIYKYNYNSEKQLIKYTQDYLAGKYSFVFKRLFKYDTKGNWIERIEIRDNKIEKITLRNLIYY